MSTHQNVTDMAQLLDNTCRDQFSSREEEDGCKKQKLLVAEVFEIGHTQIVHTATSNKSRETGRPRTRRWSTQPEACSELSPKQTRREADPLKAAASRSFGA